MTRLSLVLLTLLCVLANARPAQAHKGLDEAVRLASDLEFEASLTAFDAALASGTLTREELITLLTERAYVLHALRRNDDLVKDFIWLSALAPDHRLDLRAPPDLTATWTSVRDQGRGALKVELSAHANTDGSVEARARLLGTVPDGAKARLWLRRETGGFAALSETTLHERDAGAAELSLYADAVALGGVAIAGEHSAQNPLRIQPGKSPSKDDEHERGWASRHKGWLIGGAVVVVAAVVVTSVLVSRSDSEHNDQTQLTPMVSF